jgi:hypothetical protein
MFLMREDDKLILRGVAADFQQLQGWVGVVFVLLGLWATGGSWYVSQLDFLVLSVPLIVFGATFRIVAITLCPPRAGVTAVANPMPLLVPITNAMAIAPP